MREIALDTETTGLSPKNGDRVIEIGAIEMVNQIRTGKQFHVYINPQFPVSEGAFKVHGISNEFLADKPLMAEVIDGFLQFIGDSRLVIHNAQFDMGFLNNELQLLKRPFLGLDVALDTLQMARKKYPGGQNSLDGLCKRFNIDLTGRTLHGALLDAELLADVYAEMMGVGANQRNLLFAQNQEKENNIEDITPLTPKDGQFYAPREFNATAEERAAHQEFIDGLGGEFWKRVDNA
jgi:DNA polymerase-3 subunit epsilon